MDRGTIQVDGKPVNLSPGMAVTVEIKTGQRRIIEYLLSPLLKSMRESLRER
jgi:hemolysin D